MTDPTNKTKHGSDQKWMSWAIAVVVLAQVILTSVYLYDLLSSHFALQSKPISWQMRELFEVAGAVGLLLGISLGLFAWRKTRADITQLQSRLRVASSAFADLVHDEFEGWAFTPREREIGLFILKGLSNAEICAVTGRAEGTIKAQTNSLFRKAQVSNRGQFIGYFVEVLMQEPLT